MNKQKGFTLVELLVVIAVIGLLAVLAVASLNSGHKKERDSRRLDQVSQIKAGLEMYFQKNNAYPLATEAIVLGQESYACLGQKGFTTVAACGEKPYLDLVPAAPTPPSDSAYYYGSSDGSSYSVGFNLETGLNNLNSGAHVLSPEGIQ
ncbi:MAG: type II secretion system protein [Patescibacteria group bacterium]